MANCHFSQTQPPLEEALQLHLRPEQPVLPAGLQAGGGVTGREAWPVDRVPGDGRVPQADLRLAAADAEAGSPDRGGEGVVEEVRWKAEEGKVSEEHGGRRGGARLVQEVGPGTREETQVSLGPGKDNYPIFI